VVKDAAWTRGDGIKARVSVTGYCGSDRYAGWFLLPVRVAVAGKTVDDDDGIGTLEKR
jgi:hypothetical protein